MASMIIFGASRGLGAGFNLGVPSPGDIVWLVSRGKPDLTDRDGVLRHWIEADLSTRGANERVATAVGNAAIDVAIYNAGIWEQGAFSASYDFDRVGDDETERIVTINLVSAITCMRALLPNLRRSVAGKVILIGSTSGLDHSSGPEVAYAASKFGLRGAAHSLREYLRDDGIAVTCLNPGNIGVIKVEGGVVSSVPHEDRRMIPPTDLVEIVKCIIRLSSASCVKEIDVMAMTDRV
jgi:short-subunit dehydrogenase